MSAAGFDAEQWVARLAASLEALAPAATFSASLDAGHVTYLTYDQFRALKAQAGRDPSIREPIASGYARLSNDPSDQRAILRDHPVLKEILNGEGADERMILVKPGTNAVSSNGTSISSLISSLVVQTVNTSAFEAARALNGFLIDGKHRRLKAREFVVIYGLKLAKPIELGNGAFLAPLNDHFISQQGFSDEDAQRLRTIGVRGRAFRGGNAGSSVLVRDLTWGPGIMLQSSNLDFDGFEVDYTFACDLENLINLLSVASRRPLVTSTRHVRVADWLHTVEPNLAFSWWGGGGFFYDGWWEEADLSGEAEALFQDSVAGYLDFEFRSNSERDALSLTLLRLSRSFGRTGRMQLQDSILDCAISLEILYRLDSSELTYKLATRAAFLLEKCGKGRLRIFSKMTDFYGIRSVIVHGRRTRNHKDLSVDDFARACVHGRDLACDTLWEILHRRRFPNWKDLVLEAED